ncbi:MAG: hypothetical protein JWP01_2468 [Myxococcales bacterium]|nr:hypothetical protein [Myxococcales bacterium]
MSLRSLTLVVAACAVMACGADPKSDEPTTAREKQRREAEASGEADGGSKKWGGWRYKGDRDACFFVLGAKCFKTEAAACQAAKCKKPKKCNAVGAAPATVSCK